MQSAFRRPIAVLYAFAWVVAIGLRRDSYAHNICAFDQRRKSA